MPTTTDIAINDFARRQTRESPFSHWLLSDEQLVELAQRHLADAKPGYRDGVIRVPVPPQGFFSSVIRLQPNDRLVGKFVARREGEAPRQEVYGPGHQKLAANSVELILYSHATLDADGDASTWDADWEIVSVNASPLATPTPIHPTALIANHFGFEGGTATLMTSDEFVAALRESAEFWQDKALIAPQSCQDELAAKDARIKELEETVQHMDLKEQHGCTDAYCALCDGPREDAS